MENLQHQFNRYFVDNGATAVSYTHLDLRLRKNFRPRTGTGVRTGTLSYTQRKAV